MYTVYNDQIAVEKKSGNVGAGALNEKKQVLTVYSYWKLVCQGSADPCDILKYSMITLTTSWETKARNIEAAATAILKRNGAGMRILDAIISEIADSSDLHQQYEHHKEAMLLAIQASQYRKLKQTLVDEYADIMDDAEAGVKLLMTIFNLRQQAYRKKRRIPPVNDEQFQVIWHAKLSTLDGMSHMPWIDHHRKLILGGKKSKSSYVRDNDVDSDDETGSMQSSRSASFWKRQHKKERNTKNRILKDFRNAKKEVERLKRTKSSPKYKRSYKTHNYNDNSRYTDTESDDYDDDERFRTPSPKRRRTNKPPSRKSKSGGYRELERYRHLTVEDIDKPNDYDTRNGVLFGTIG